MATFDCLEAQVFYDNPENPTASQFWEGASVYGDQSLFFNAQGGCNVADNNAKAITYNHYCGTATSNSDYIERCTSLWQSVSGNSNLVFHKIVDNEWDNFNYTQIPNFSMWGSENRKFHFSNSIFALKKTFNGSVTLAYSSLNQSGFFISLLNSTIVHLIAPGLPVICVALCRQTGLVYYVTNDLHTYSYDPFLEKSKKLSTVAAPFTNLNDDLPNIMYSSAMPGFLLIATKQFTDKMYKYDFETNLWSPVTLFIPNFSFSGAFASTLVGDVWLVGLYNNLIVNPNNISPEPFYSVNGSILISVPFPVVLPNVFTNCDETIYRNQDTGQYNAFMGWSTTNINLYNNLTELQVCELGPDTFNRVNVIKPPAHADSTYIGMGWGGIGSNYVLFDAVAGCLISQTVPTFDNNWTQLSSFVYNQNSITTGFAMFVGGNTVTWPQWGSDGDVSAPLTDNWWGIKIASISQFVTLISNPTNPNLFTESLSFFMNTLISLPGASFILLDNGEIRCYSSMNISSNTTCYWISSTSDQSVPSSTIITAKNYVQILFENALTVSANGLYILSFTPQTGKWLLMQNVINGSAIAAWGSKGVLIPTYQDNYCNEMPTNANTAGIKNTFPDPRCLCYNPRELTASLFNVELLASNPAQLLLLDSTSPCLFKDCTQERGTDTITGIYMDDQVKCPSTITICSTILNVGQDGSISTGTGVNVDQNCGGTAGKTPCSSTCPVGMGCAKDGFCALSCVDNSECVGSGQTCNAGVCELAKNSGTAIPDWAIALIVIVFVFLILGISLGVFYSRKAASYARGR